ncbi:T9SS type A sorting domain-containing protein [Chryseobacterium sp. B21-037]|uniref:T9SS type A sorting domain-containing protein n=1 Tax=unclassified Chryseobacterium TaxID=2593645 RepID=UPI00235A4416|nr:MULTISPECIES: T9SS type A sorting domain-containing protein [unclassified Chryseobacterium]MDC8105570.1 T9SS type A sorting domain-containing protein [Chryseobacterium sp. B21-037]MDQ1806403.1 T9SS type A sorting domain-containing protein [Chryseobacterium sp. CKR4-1]
MKNLFYLLFFTLNFLSLSAQAPSIVWQKTFGGTGTEEFFDIQATNDGGYITIGDTTSSNGDVTTNHGSTDLWIVKVNSSGTIQWQKTYGGSNIDRGFKIQQTTDGGYIAIGSTSSTDGDIMGNHGGYDLWILKLDDSGNIVWQKTLGGSADEDGVDIQQTNEGGYIAIGSTYSTDGDITSNHGQRDMWIIKLDSSGNIQWQNTYGFLYQDDGNQIRQTPDGSYVVIGSYNFSSTDTSDFWILKLDPSGVVIWEKTYGGTSRENPYDIQNTSDNGYILVGYTQSSDGDITGNHGQGEVWMLKLNSSGDLQWQKTFGGTSSDYGEAIQRTLDGGYIIAGNAQSTNGDVTGNHGSSDFWIIKTDSSGNIMWQKSLGGTGNEMGRSIIEIADGTYIVVGGTYSTDGDITINKGLNDGWMVKVQTEQLSTTENNIKNNISLYPNPAKDLIYLDNLPAGTTVQITDMSGRKLQSQKYNNKKSSINTSQLTNGIYIIHGEHQGKNILSEKLIIEK